MDAVDKDPLLEDEIEAGADRILFPDPGDLGDARALEWLEGRRVEAGGDDALPAAVFVCVLLRFGVSGYFISEGLVLKLRDHLARRRVLHPAREKTPPGMLHGGI